MKALPFSQLINTGIQQLASLQEKDGSFLSLSSPDEHNFIDAISYSTTFLNSFILLETTSLSSTTELSYLRNKTANFLLSHKSEYWSWNYWQRYSQEAKELTCPDDLDVTFCSLAALFHYDKKIITGDIFAYVVKILTATEKKEGGPYRTWLVGENASDIWKDVDIAVNSNVAYFLSLHDISLPSLTKYIEGQIKKKKLTSPYYPSFYAPVYFLSRFYKGEQKKIIIDMLWEKRDKEGIWENPLKTALATLSLLNLGMEPKKLKNGITYLLNTHKKSLWPAYGFSIDPSKNGKQYFAGSVALTTVFCLKALHNYQLAHKENNKKNQMTSAQYEERDLYYQEITKKIKDYYATHGELLGDTGEKLLLRITSKDINNQIPLLSYYFSQSLRKKSKIVTKNFLIKLGMANVLGWVAYTIYDDFLDEEGDPSLLPLAIISLRQLTYIFDTFTVRKKRIQKLYHTLLNKVDRANMEELQKRSDIKNSFELKDIDQLADKSIGHALGPLAIIILLGYTQESKEFKNILAFFTHYLIAKQLNDDAHDWEEDLKKKHITPIVALLLNRAQEKKIIKKLKNLQEIFWQEIIQEVCELIYQHARKAKIALKKSTIISDPTMLENLLAIPVGAADKALEEQKNVNVFLKTYQQ